MFRTLILSLIGGITATSLIEDPRILLETYLDENQDLYGSAILVVAGMAFYVGSIAGIMVSLGIEIGTKKPNNPFPGSENVFKKYELTEAEKKYIEDVQKREDSGELDLPNWACCPITHSLLIHPYLTITKTPNTSQTYEQQTIIEINNNFGGICHLSQETIIGGILNRPLQQAIKDYIRSSNNTGYSFFSPSNKDITPRWMKCESTGEIMQNPCLALIKGKIKSVDQSIAQDYPHVINRSLREAIEDYLKKFAYSEYNQENSLTEFAT